MSLRASMLSPKKDKRNRPDTAPSTLMSLVMQSVPPLAGEEVCERFKSHQLICDKLNPVPEKTLLNRSVSDDTRRYSIDDSILNGSVKAKLMHRKVLDVETSQRSREFEDVVKSKTMLSADDGVIGAKNVRNVLQFFKRRTSESNTPIPSLEVIESWSQNFSNLLNDKYGLMLFRNFLLSEYSEENIEFWIACEEYKKLKARQYAQKAASIYSDFVTVHAPKEVNLDSKTRVETMKALTNPTKVTFDLAQSRIQCLMEKDSYTRFLKSNSYTSLLSQARASSCSSSSSATTE